MREDSAVVSWGQLRAAGLHSDIAVDATVLRLGEEKSPFGSNASSALRFLKSGGIEEIVKTVFRKIASSFPKKSAIPSSLWRDVPGKRQSY
jgi:hypothetical protein